MKRSSIIYNKEYITEHSNQALNLMWELMARCVYRYGSRLIIEFPKEGDYIPSYTMDFCPTDGSGKFLKDDEYVCVVYDDATGEEIACFVDYGYACRWLTDLVTNNDFYAIYNFDTEDSKKIIGAMESKRTFAIFFEDFTKAAQKRIIAEELGRVTGDEGVSHITVATNEDLYGYNPNPDNQTLEQHLHVKARHNGHDHKWLMVWDCMEAEFTTLMEDNQK